MTEDRETALLAHVPTLHSLDEALSFRLEITKQEPMGSRLLSELSRRIDHLKAKEGRR